MEDKIIKDEEKRLILDSLKKLKSEYERAIYLADFEDLSYEEITKVLGKNMSQTKVLIHRARKALKKIIEEGVKRDEK